MGSGKYSYDNATTRSTFYATQDVFTNFSRREVHHEMKSVGVKLRESRDSDEHPKSKAIIIGLDVTGSMGVVPQELVIGGLPEVMKRALEVGVEDPQIMFLAIGDHYTDRAPLQVGQFESSDELIEKWLTNVWLEGNGGGNGGESYMLAWYFASRHTSIDCWEKRKDKGLLITIGDEAVHDKIEAFSLKQVMGQGEYSGDYSTAQLLADVRESYDVHHIHILDWAGSTHSVRNQWKELMGNNVHEVINHKEIPGIISQIMINKYRSAIQEDSTKDSNEEITEAGTIL